MKSMIVLFLLVLAFIATGCDGGESPGNDAAEDETGGDHDSGDDIGGDSSCADMLCEGSTPHCCDGQCRECCEGAHCDDENECTVDACADGTCVNEPLDDRSLCTDGICCGSQCRLDGECCASSDCVGGCKGTERICGDFSTEEQCASQSGCLWSGNTGCTGSLQCDHFGGVDQCEGCGCDWTFSPNDCHQGSSFDCRADWDEATCYYCHCDWVTATCEGTHGPCSSYPNEDLCNDQLDCYWSACVDYQCT